MILERFLFGDRSLRGISRDDMSLLVSDLRHATTSMVRAVPSGASARSCHDFDLLARWTALLLRLEECTIKAHRLTGLAGLR